MTEARVLLAVVTGAHGVSGRVRLKTFTEDPADVAGYGPLSDEAGERHFDIRVTGAIKGGVVAELGGVRNRNAAEALKGAGLYVERSALPESEDEEEFYHADLIGLSVETGDGKRLGRIRAIHDFGAGDVLDVRSARGKGLLLPFTREVATEIDLAGGRVIVVVPDEIEIHDAPEVAEETDSDPS